MDLHFTILNWLLHGGHASAARAWSRTTIRSEPIVEAVDRARARRERMWKNRMEDSRFEDSGFEIRDSGFEIPDSRFRIRDSEIPDSRFEIPDSRFEIPDCKNGMHCADRTCDHLLS